jgi:hypothetical protein
MPDWDLMHGIPVKVILAYVHSTLGTDHYKPGDGHSAGTIAKKLAKSVKEQGEGYLRLGQVIEGMRYEDQEILLRLRRNPGTSSRPSQASKHASDFSRDDAGVVDEISVDRIIIATQASAAKDLLGMLDRALADHGDKAERRRISAMRRALDSVEYRVSHGTTQAQPRSTLGQSAPNLRARVVALNLRLHDLLRLLGRPTIRSLIIRKR